MGKEKKERSVRQTAVKCIFLAVLLLAAIVWMHWMDLRRSAKSKLSMLNSNARTVFLLAESYRADGHSAGELAGCERLDDSSGASGLTAYIAENTEYQKGDCYAVVCDDLGNIRYTLYSHSRISEKVLNDPPQAGDGESRDRMLRMLETPIRWRYAVGVYYPSVIRSLPEQSTETN